MARRSSSRNMWTAKLAGKDVAPVAVAALGVAVGRPFRGIVLGIDPSLRGTGLAIVEARGRDDLVLHASLTLKLETRLSMTECLGRIAAAVNAQLDGHAVDHVAVEETIYVQNFRTAQILGMARGAAIATAALRGLPIHEYSPLRVKQAVSGFGRASKEQISEQMKGLLKLTTALPFDESDAAAVAACHAFTWKG